MCAPTIIKFQYALKSKVAIHFVIAMLHSLRNFSAVTTESVGEKPEGSYNVCANDQSHTEKPLCFICSYALLDACCTALHMNSVRNFSAMNQSMLLQKKPAGSYFCAITNELLVLSAKRTGSSPKVAP